MKRDKRIRILNIIINFIITMCVLIFVGLIIGFAGLENKFVPKGLFNIGIDLIFATCFFRAILTLKKILKSINNKDPFSQANIRNFQIIGYCFMAIALIDGILSYPKENTSGIEIFATSYGSLKPLFILYLILGIISFVLGDVFILALEIKDENDLTV